MPSETFDLGLDFNNVINNIRYTYYSPGDKIFYLYIPLTDDTLYFNLSQQQNFESCVKYVAQELNLYTSGLIAGKTEFNKKYTYCSGVSSRKFLKFFFNSNNFNRYLVANNLHGNVVISKIPQNN